MDVAEIERIGAEAADDFGPAPEAAGQLPALPVDVVESFADFLDMAANVAATGFDLQTVPQRFTHEANRNISAAAVKLCEKYGKDPATVLLGGDSMLSAWLGLAIAVGLPGFACWRDFKAAQAAKVRAKDDGEGAAESQQQQQGE